MKKILVESCPHKKNGTWSLTSPNGISNTRNDEKVMIFVAIFNGKVPVVDAFMNVNGRRKIVKKTATSTSCKGIFAPPSVHVFIDKVYDECRTVILPISPLPLKNSC